jgi:hypothetical protein
MQRRMTSLMLLLVAVAILPAPLLAAGDTMTIAAGTTLDARLTTLLSTKTSQNGDPFTARTMDPVFSGGEEVVPAGSTIEGHVTFVKEPGRVKGKAEMRLVADKIVTPGDMEFSLTAGLENAQGAEGAKVKGEEGTIQGPGKSTKGTVVESGVDAGIGAGVGAIAAGGKGSLYGLGIGAVTGIVKNLAKKHKDLVLPPGTELTFVVSRTTTAKKVVHQDDSISQ